MSRFCGRITERVEQLANETGGNEPWLFVVDDDGTVLGRWDNVVDLDAVRDLLELWPKAPRYTHHPNFCDPRPSPAAPTPDR